MGMTASATSRPARIARNTTLNLAGFILPMAIGVFSIPPLLAYLGKERFGVLMLVFMVVGYLSPLDLGLGRATTRAVAEALSQRRPEGIAVVIWSSLSLLALLGVLGGVVLAVATPWLVGKVLIIPGRLQAETRVCFWYVAGSVPFVIVGGALRGALEGAERFDVVNWLKVLSSSAKYGLPLVVLLFGRGLSAAVATIGLVSVLTVVAYAVIVARIFPGLAKPVVSSRVFKAQLSFGTWTSVTNAATTAINSLDRLVIGSTLGLNAVTLYAAPQEIMNRLTILPTSLVTTLFPIFSRSGDHDGRASARIHAYAVKFLLLAMVVVVASFLLFADRLLDLWLGSDFGREGATVLRILAVGVFINSVGYPSFALLQGVGRPDITARLYLVELPVYAGLVMALVRTCGVTGVAVAYAIRSACELFWYWYKLGRVAPQCGREAKGVGLPAAALCAVALALLSCLLLLVPAASGLVIRTLLLTMLAGIYACGVWRWAIGEDERGVLAGTLRASAARVWTPLARPRPE
jgi:O-antigen/teichoic acid export membrane protein